MNLPSAVECSKCGFPLNDRAFAPPEPPAAGTDPPPIQPFLRRPARFRPRPRRVDPTSATLWIVFGGFAACVVLWIAIQSTLQKAGPPPVPGSTEPIQASADSLNRVLARDSTDVEARQKLADIYYDTGNWELAIVQYRAVVRLDTTRTTALVDLGVCYFNLSDSQVAEKLFLQALTREPQHSVALFNLGIVYENRKEYPAALEYFRRCLASNPPPMMRDPVSKSIDRVQLKMKAG